VYALRFSGPGLAFPLSPPFPTILLFSTFSLAVLLNCGAAGFHQYEGGNSLSRSPFVQRSGVRGDAGGVGVLGTVFPPPPSPCGVFLHVNFLREKRKKRMGVCKLLLLRWFLPVVPLSPFFLWREQKEKKRVPCIHILQGCQHTLPLQKGVTHRETATITGRVFCKKRKKKRDKAPSVCIRLAFSNVLFLFLLSCVVFRFRTLFSSSCCTADTLRPDTHTNLKSISLARLLVVSLLRR
jgi:hypothetical protein